MRLARTRGSRRGRGVLGACAVAGFAMVVAACGPVGSGVSSSPVGTTPTNGGTATYATIPGLPADYIFPFTPGADFSATNSDDLQYLLYRPLYWFGDGTQPTLNPQLSLADPPKFSGRTVTITLKPYFWSNGQPVTAENVIFWINMEKAEETGGTPAGSDEYGGYVPGTFPDNIKDWHATGPRTLVMTLDGSYSQEWFTDNELSQITPMPSAWDVTASGTKGGCEAAISGCQAVYNYLTSPSVGAGNPVKWGSSPIWSVVDGPWQVTSATAQNQVTMRYNTRYSGPAAADHVSTFVLEAFTTEQAEYNQLEDPGNNPVSVGYLPTVDAPVPAAGEQVGSNPVSLTNYKLTVIYPWMLSYYPYNWRNPTVGPIFDQLYFRQAFQMLQDQEGVVSGPMHGYGKVTIGPVTDYPVTSYLSHSLEMQGDLYTLNPSKAAALLRKNGWSVNTSGTGTTFCAHPGTGSGECGAGIKLGTKLDFTMVYAAGVDWMESAVKELVSNASLIGINITANSNTTTNVVDIALGSSTSWDLAEWGSWTYSPDYLPTGDELFLDGSPFGGFYDNATNNAMIEKTLTAQTTSAFDHAMYNWEEYLAKNLPVVWTPNVATLVESVNNLVIGPQSSTLTINPEDWYYVK